MEKIKIFSLGGLNENGKNLYVVDINNKLVIFDCGIKYAPDKMYGVDYVIPDFSILSNRSKDIVGVFISHPHSENMGSLLDLVKEIPDINVYASKFSSEIIKIEEQENNIQVKNLHIIEANRKIEFNDFSIFPFSVTHSTPQTLGYSLNTKNGSIIYMADYVIDPTMKGLYDMDLGKIAYMGKQGVLCLMCESLFAEKKGHTSPNHKLETFFKDIINDYEGRIVFSLLPLHIYTIQEIFNTLKGKNRKVVIMGKELHSIVNMCIKNGYLDIDNDLIGNLTDLKSNNTVILIGNDRQTPYSNINRILNGRDKFITLNKHDTVVFAEPSYDAYEKTLVKLMNELSIRGINVETIPKEKSVRHHASSEDILLLIKLFNPKYYMPIKGEYRYQVENGNLALKVGLDAKNIILKENGNIVEIEDGKLLDTYDSLQVGDVLIDGNITDDIGDIVLKDREMLSQNGLVLISASLNKRDKSIVIMPEVVTRGFLYANNDEIINNIKEISLKIIKDSTFNSKYVDYQKLRNELREQVGSYLYKETKGKPVILTVVQEV